MADPYPYGIPDFRHLIAAAGRGRTHVRTDVNVNHPRHLPEPPCLGGANNSYDDVVFSHGFTTHLAHHHDDYSSSSMFVNIPNPTVITSAPDASSADHIHGGAAIFCSNNNNNNNNSIDVAASVDKGSWLGFDAAPNNRWPRQETLSLLEIRSRLDSKFRLTNHKAPLWNQISRIMEEEYGYQRSGKKCKEKFENLYKYYKKTKEGKAGRQDGKHYRFFRQLEAICGEASTTPTPPTPQSHHHHHHALLNTTNYQTPLNIKDASEVLHHHHDHNNLIIKCCNSKSLSLSNNSISDQFETSSSENNNVNDVVEDLSAIATYMMKQKGIDHDDDDDDDQEQQHQRRRRRRSSCCRRGNKVEELVDSHMRKIMETQDAWVEKMMSVVEQREQAMASKEEEMIRNKIMIRSSSSSSSDPMRELRAKERAWIEARDTALMEVVKKHMGKELLEEEELLVLQAASEPMVVQHEEEEEEENNNNNNVIINGGHGGWTELEISNLIQLGSSGFEVRSLIHEGDGVWEEIGGKMRSLGYNRSGSECKETWSEIRMSLNKMIMECSSRSRSSTSNYNK